MDPQLPKPAEVGAFYDQYTRLFEILWGDSLHFGYWPSGSPLDSIEAGQERLTQLMIEKAGVERTHDILDVGCGTGRASLSLAITTGCRVTGVNVSAQQVASANARARGHDAGARVEFQIADAMAMPFPDAQFDGAWAFESLLHMPSLPGALREVARVLKPGARFVISDVVSLKPLPAEDEAYYRQVFPVAPLVSKTSYADYLRGAGFEVDEVLDITDSVERTLTLTLQNIDSNRSVIQGAYGEGFDAIVQSSWGKGIDIHLRSLGYCVFVAHTPAR